MKELNWGGLGTSIAAGKLIARKEPFTVTLRGAAAETLKNVAGPGVALNRALLSSVASNLALTTLPGLMLYALGSGYRLAYDNLGAEGLRMRFQRAGGSEATPNEAKASSDAPKRDSKGA